jgi:hypothetical protein
MKKGLAIKIASGVLVVALVVVVALAITGVFSGKKTIDPIVANAEDASVSNVAVFRNIETDKVFYIQSSKSITDVSSYVNVRANGKDVSLKISDKKDENGNVGFTASNGWASGVAYRVSLISSDVAFVEEQYKEMTSFIFIVAADEAMDCEISDKVVELKDFDASLEVLETNADGVATKWTLIVNNVEGKFADDTVFVYEDNLDISKVDENGTLHSYAVKLDANTPASYDKDGKTYMATVVDAAIDDVFDVLNVHTNVGLTEENFKFDEEATIKSILNSDMYLSTVRYLYAEELGNKSFDIGKYGKLSLDYNFKTGSPSRVTFDVTLSFTGFLKSAANASVTIKIANVLTPEFHGNFQKDPLAFDASLDLNVETTVTVNGGFDYVFNNTDPDNNTEANVALKNVVDKVAGIVKDALGTENKTEKSFIFATWVIPIGTTPIQVVESMGIEVKAEVSARLGASLKNNFSVELGIAYCDHQVTPISNVKDDFKIGMITLAGTAGAKVGLYNEIGITACGVISVNLDLSVGVYCDVAGRLEMDGWEIMNGNFGIDPAYYVEAGIYLDMDISGKVLVFNIAKQNILSKKWPLWSTGYKYIPQVDTTSEEYAALTADEDMYLNGSYFFFTNFKALALDIQNLNDTKGSLVNIDWDEFNYDYNKEYLTMVDNKVRVAATAPNEFTTDIVVTSKVNRYWKKTIHVIKTPEAPTAANPEKSYKKGSNSALKYAVRLNSSKFIGISSSDYTVAATDYEYEDDVLTLKPELLETMSYGLNTLLFESSKGYLQLYVNVFTDKDIVPANGFAIAQFDKSVPANAEFDIDLLGYEISKVEGLEQNEWVYSNSTDTFKILATALLEEEVGYTSYGIEFSNGEKAQLVVNVVDNRLPVLNTNVYDYKIGSGANLDLDVTLYGNTITYLELGNKNITSYLDGQSIDASYFDNFAKAQTVKGSFQAAGNVYSFTVNLGVNNMVILPVKYVEFDKNSAKDVTILASIPENVKLAGDNLTTGKSIGANLSQDEDGITVSASYLKGLASGKYTFKLIGGENEPEFVIKVVDTTAPVVDTTAISAKKGVDVNKKVAWSLAEYTVEDVEIDGLTPDQYTVSSDALVLVVDALKYGVTEFTVTTPVNAFALTVSVDGSPRFIQTDYILNLKAGEELVIKTDLAGKKLYDIKFAKDGKEVEIYNTQFRNNEGVITISNDYAYALEQGTYSISVYPQDSEALTGAKLVVKGELTSYTQVANCDGQSEETAYLIYNKAQFLSMVAETNKKLLGANNFDGVYFKLMADIDLEYATVDPIGKKIAPFKGGFDGNGYTISNIKISDVNNEYTGLFAYNEGTIKNLRIANITVDVSKAGNVGIGLVVGHNSGLIKNVHVVGGKINAVSKSWLDIQNAYFDIGGLVGYNDGSKIGNGLKRNIEKCSCEVEINAEVKGLSIAGINIGGRKSCINVGAIVGYFKSGVVYRCEVTADINAKAHNNNINSNGWYGNTELDASELAECMKRCQVTEK